MRIVQECIDRAVRFLSATQQSDGSWIYWEAQTGSHWDVTRDDLIDLGVRIYAAEAEAYSRWRASGAGRELQKSIPLENLK